MDLIYAAVLAKNLIAEHNIDKEGWSFKYDNAKKRFGCCHYKTKLITLSRYLVELNTEDKVKDVILHEIAHAIAGFEAGHGIKWKRVAEQIGCKPERCYDSKEVIQPKGNYEAVCPVCGYIHKAIRRKRKESSCAICLPGKFDRSRLLVFKKI